MRRFRNISRREFLTKSGESGLLFLAPSLLLSAYQEIHGESWRDAYRNELESRAEKEPLPAAIMAAILAPNPHNTQAWKFAIHDANLFFL